MIKLFNPVITDNTDNWTKVDPRFEVSWSEMDDWIDDNATGRVFWEFTRAIFEYEQDAILFKLRWGS